MRRKRPIRAKYSILYYLGSLIPYGPMLLKITPTIHSSYPVNDDI